MLERFLTRSRRFCAQSWLSIDTQKGFTLLAQAQPLRGGRSQTRLPFDQQADDFGDLPIVHPRLDDGCTPLHAALELGTSVRRLGSQCRSPFAQQLTGGELRQTSRGVRDAGFQG